MKKVKGRKLSDVNESYYFPIIGGASPINVQKNCKQRPADKINSPKGNLSEVKTKPFIRC
jgi:hypothetical protein